MKKRAEKKSTEQKNRTEQHAERRNNNEKNEKRKKCIHQPWLLLLFQLQLTYVIVYILFIFLFFSIPGWFAIYSKDSCSTFQNDSNNTNRLDVDFVDFALTAVVVVFSKIRKKTSSRSSFRFELGITSYVRFLWFWILKDGFPRDLESNLYWKTEKTTNDFSP